jgi:gamma-glutamyltranspeptidase/glutathione hydrolase
MKKSTLVLSQTLLKIGICCLLVILPAKAQRSAVEAHHGAVTSAHVLASEAGLEILKKGGNAVDAAIATGFALEVVYPFAGNLGGGGFMMIHTADGKDTSIDYREKAPSAASRDMYIKNGKLTKGPGSSTVGWRASGVPGSVAGFAYVFQKYGSGKVTWAEIIEPARRLAANGHKVSQATANLFHRMHHDQLLGQFAESKHIYLKDGEFLKAGENWKQPDLAETLARIQKDGPSEFYEGKTAQLIADAMAKNGGTITLEDLKAYQAVERVPLRGKYRGYDVVTMPPPSSGGIAILQMLQMLEKYNVRDMGPNSAAKDHLFIEVMRRAFRDRAEYLGDPDFVKVPVDGLLDTNYVQSLMANYDPSRASVSAGFKPGKPKGWEAVPTLPAGHESNETTQFTVVDAAGAAVSNTYTLNGGFGSGVTIPGTGLLMNNEMDDFAAQPGTPNMFGLVQGEANAIAPGKRPLSSMTPTFVFKDGKLFIATGSPGGPTIINTVLEIITNVIDHGMPMQQAVEAPRFHHQWMPDIVTFERYGLSPDTEKLLVGMGHKITPHSNFEGFYQGDGESIMMDPKTHLILGAADPRKDDSKAVGF